MFFDAASSLVKQPVLWLVGLMRATGVRPASLTPDQMAQVRYLLDRLGQVPFEPPSVGGWPAGRAWLTTGGAYYRYFLAGIVARHADLAAVAGAGRAARPAAVAAALGVDGWTGRTAAALDSVADDPQALLVLGACAPEYVVSR